MDEKVAGQGQGAAPLARAGLGGQPFDARLLVVVGLGHRGVGLVAPGGADGFVLIIDAGRSFQGLLQVVGPVQGAGPPQLIDAQYLVGDGNPALRAHFLLDQGRGKDGRQVGRGDGLAGARVEIRRHGGRQVGNDVVPLLGHLGFAQVDLVRVHISEVLLGERFRSFSQKNRGRGAVISAGEHRLRLR